MRSGEDGGFLPPVDAADEVVLHALVVEGMVALALLKNFGDSGNVKIGGKTGRMAQEI